VEEGTSGRGHEHRGGARCEIGTLGAHASPTLSETVLDVLGYRDIPVLGNVEFGYAGPNLPMPVGTHVGQPPRGLP
jgi:muramoyltetrapeptide carboxypeptidase